MNPTNLNNMIKILSAFFFLLLLPTTLLAEGITQEQGKAILEELKAIKKELHEIKQNGFAPKTKPKGRPTTAQNVATLGSPILGDLKAPVTLIEFTDYECPFCKKFYKNAMQKLKKEYIDTGKLRLVVRDFPLPFHKNARPAANAAHCAGEQDKFWPMHDALYEGNKMNAEDIKSHATKIGLKLVPFQSCLDSKRYKKHIDNDMKEAQIAGIRGTPAFILGKTTDNLVSGEFISGTRDINFFKSRIDKLLK
ncbi:MAG: protein-disulfide isomerase [Nitrospinales bacterium]|jgi:protein-disulfide isomerase